MLKIHIISRRFLCYFNSEKITECFVLQVPTAPQNLQSNFNLPTQSALHIESLYFLQQWSHNKPVYYTPRYTYHCGIKKERENHSLPLSLSPYYAELRDTIGSPKHKTGWGCSGFCTGGITQVSCHYLTIDTTGLCILPCVRPLEKTHCVRLT